MNNFKVEIYKNKEWVDYTSKCVFPLKIADFLDEQLDECELFIKKVKDEYFNPLTIFKITLINTPNCLVSPLDVANIKARAQDKTIIYEYNENTKHLTERKERFFIVATDNSLENPIGSGYYEHTIYLIESTKILEGFIGDSITFTNSLGNNYAESVDASFLGADGSIRICKGFSVVNTPSLRVPTFYEFIGDNYKEVLWPYTTKPVKYIKIRNSLEEVLYYSAIEEGPSDEYPFKKVVRYGNIDTTTDLSNIDAEGNNLEDFNIGGQEIVLTSGTYTIEYEGRMSGGDTVYFSKYTAVFNITESYYPTKKWTITEVINRCLDLIEPLNYGEKPRFRLSGVEYDEEGNAGNYKKGSLAEKYDKILAPEFSFAKATLREQLQQIGGFIHGEPRVVDIHFDEENPWFEIGFDKYGSSEKSTIKGLKKPVTVSLTTDINNYATRLDSSVDNLVNQLDFASGVVVEPFYNGEKTLRTDTVYIRLGEENNTFISTSLPIYSIKKVYCTYIPNNDEITEDVNITPYIFEKADYDNLSSYNETYPTSKAYGLYYTQGQKNISGLWYKVEDAIDTSVFSKYSIINILKSASGKDITKPDGLNYPLLAFRVEYVPLFASRVQTNKQTIIGGLPRSMAYNQSANIVESKYYGENLKGAIARMGNVEKTMTYNLAFISDIPKTGTKYDHNYYISTTSTECLPSYIKCMLGLSKHFNRLSEYIGVSSYKRMWEVSEKQSQQRDSIHPEYVVITENKNMPNDSNCFLSKSPTILLNYSEVDYPVTAMNIKRYSKNKKSVGVGNIFLPVVSSVFGNSMCFTVSFQDNYSAGISTVRHVNNEVEGEHYEIEGTFSNTVQYGDYYGRLYYLWYELMAGKNLATSSGSALSYPYGNIKGLSIGKTVDYGKKYRKDSREIPQITFELAVVTDSDDIIIGSAITKNCSLVNPNPQEIELWAFREDINKVNSVIDFSNADKLEGFNVYSDRVEIPAISSEYSAWALVTKATKKTIKTEDEDGDIFNQTIYSGGELVLGQNKVFANAKTFYFRKKRKIYD